MNKLIFDETTYNLALNGLSVSNDTLVAKIVDDNYDFEDVEAAVAPIETIKQTLEDGTQIASYKGFTKLVSINKLFNQLIDQEAHTHEEVVPKIDPETGEPVIDPETGEIETETIIVTDYTPVYGDVLAVTLFQPTLEDTVADQGEQITEIQEVLVGIIG